MKKKKEIEKKIEELKKLYIETKEFKSLQRDIANSIDTLYWVIDKYPEKEEILKLRKLGE